MFRSSPASCKTKTTGRKRLKRYKETTNPLFCISHQSKITKSFHSEWDFYLNIHSVEKFFQNPKQIRRVAVQQQFHQSFLFYFCCLLFHIVLMLDHTVFLILFTLQINLNSVEYCCNSKIYFKYRSISFTGNYYVSTWSDRNIFLLQHADEVYNGIISNEITRSFWWILWEAP